MSTIIIREGRRGPSMWKKYSSLSVFRLRLKRNYSKKIGHKSAQFKHKKLDYKKKPFKVGNVRSSRAFSFLQLFLYVYHVLRVLAEGVHEVLGLDLAGANPENIL